MQRSRGFGSGVVASKICYNAVIVLSVVLSDRCKPKNSFRDWALATAGWKRGCQPFSCPCSQNATHCRKKPCSLCTFKTFPFWNSKHPLPTRSLRLLRETMGSTSSALCLHHAHPFVSATEKCQSHAEKQRVWSQSCGLQDLLQCSDCALSCSVWLLQTISNQWTVVEIELLAFFATVGWKWGCQPFSCPCSQNATRCRKKPCSLCTFKTFPFWNSKHPLPTRSLRLLRAAVRSTSSAILCLHHFDRFVAATEKASLIQRNRGFGHGVAVSKICYNAVIVLSVVLWDCCNPTNTCRDWDFSNSGLEVGLPAFQLPMFAKCDALPKGALLFMYPPSSFLYKMGGVVRKIKWISTWFCG